MDLQVQAIPTTGWWFGTSFYIFPYIGNFILPIDEVIFFRGVESTNHTRRMIHDDGDGDGDECMNGINEGTNK